MLDAARLAWRCCRRRPIRPAPGHCRPCSETEVSAGRGGESVVPGTCRRHGRALASSPPVAMIDAQRGPVSVQHGAGQHSSYQVCTKYSLCTRYSCIRTIRAVRSTSYMQPTMERWRQPAVVSPRKACFLSRPLEPCSDSLDHHRLGTDLGRRCAPSAHRRQRQLPFPRRPPAAVLYMPPPICRGPGCLDGWLGRERPWQRHVGCMSRWSS